LTADCLSIFAVLRPLKSLLGSFESLITHQAVKVDGLVGDKMIDNRRRAETPYSALQPYLTTDT